MTSRRTFLRQSSLITTGLMTSSLLAEGFPSIPGSPSDQLRSNLKHTMQMLRIPGMLAAVVKDGQLSFVQCEGFADLERKAPMRQDIIFPVASLTKTFAAVIMAQYDQEGKASLNDYVLDYPFLSVGFTPERLPSPDVRIWHALSHTSEGVPGTEYIYNGGRYNFVYGVYEHISGNTTHYEAFADEVKKRVATPLGMQHTYPGYPKDKTLDPSRIVTTYQLDKATGRFSIPDKNQATQTILYPSANLFTSLEDLVKYTNALDNNLLISKDTYTRITTPVVTPQGRKHPYGIGWASQLFEDKQVHWHYGYGDSFAALIVRVPSERLTFILFSNAVPASEAFRLGYGNLMSSPFAVSFLHHFVAKNKLKDDGFDLLFPQAMTLYYQEQTLGAHEGGAKALLRNLAAKEPERFKQPDLMLLWLMTTIADKELSELTEKGIEAYKNSGRFQPDIHLQIAQYYQQIGKAEASRSWYHLLADSTGFEEQGSVRDACTYLGKHYLSVGQVQQGRKYLWKEVMANRIMNNSTDDAAVKIALMNTGK
ncbi:beta-lactamase family protein [Chitinophaga filiformis]|uniref:serine hydrolase domain-containing protein n=1 Tax=Chitinophaga filiformis TaxID=104663 RepID=UPI001F2DF938|nr:serine hydrolase domain-containing protein [Chitinophaga filiformis]MCF6403730.1 beta-lactamase family protein [Chitinophaga filiformis]